MKELIFRKVTGPTACNFNENYSPSKVLLKDFDHKFLNTYLSEQLPLAAIEFNKNGIGDNAQVLKLLSQVTREILCYYYVKQEFLIMQMQISNGFIFTNKMLTAEIEL